MIEELDLGPIEERLKAATPGPWEAYCRDSGGRDGSFLGWEVHGPPDADRGQFEKGVDAQFIANAPTDIAALLQRVKELEGELAEAKRTQVKDGGRGQLRPFPEPDGEE